MFIRMNDGESIVIQARNSDDPKKSICVICRGNWIGLREFDNAPDLNSRSSDEDSLNKGYEVNQK